MAKKVIAHYLQGTLVRGITRDFRPNRLSFHIEVNSEDDPVKIQLSDLKAVFFVKDLEGVREKRVTCGREIGTDEIDSLLRSCRDDKTPAGARDCAMIAVATSSPAERLRARSRRWFRIGLAPLESRRR